MNFMSPILKSGPNFVSQMQFYRAVVYDSIGGSTSDTRDRDGGDDRYPIRILPNMQNVAGDKLKNLPRFPFLFCNKKPCFKTEKEYGEDADRVLVMCSSDFSMGYIVGGPISKWTGTRNQDMQEKSWPFLEFFQIAQERDRTDIKISTNFKYSELTVDAWASGDGSTQSGAGSLGSNLKAGYVICHNEKTGDMFWINGSGSMMALGAGYFTVNVGGKDQGGNGTTYSELIITPGKVHITTDVFDVEAKQKVTLGRSGLTLIGTSSKLPSSATGMGLAPVQNVSA